MLAYPLLGRMLNLRAHKNTGLFLKWLFGGIIVPLVLVPLVFQIYITPSQHKKQQMRLEIQKLNNIVRTLFFMDEETFRFCTDNKNTPVDSRYQEELSKINTRRDRIFKELVDFSTDLYDQNVIPRQTYKRVSHLAQWNNTLYYSHNSVCRIQLKDTAELLAWRNRLSRELVGLN